MELTKEQRELLRPYEGILSKCFFKAHKSTYIDYETSGSLAEVYLKITGKEVDCRGCGDKSWIKRLSAWYCGNKNGILPQANPKTDEVAKPKRTRKPKE